MKRRRGRPGPDPALYLEHMGASVPMTWIARTSGINYGTLYYRFHVLGLRDAALVAPVNPLQSQRTRAA